MESTESTEQKTAQSQPSQVFLEASRIPSPSIFSHPLVPVPTDIAWCSRPKCRPRILATICKCTRDGTLIATENRSLTAIRYPSQDTRLPSEWPSFDGWHMLPVPWIVSLTGIQLMACYVWSILYVLDAVRGGSLCGMACQMAHGHGYGLWSNGIICTVDRFAESEPATVGGMIESMGEWMNGAGPTTGMGWGKCATGRPPNHG